VSFVGWVHQFGNVLDQSAAESNLDYLQAAADTEHGTVRLEKPFKQAELHLVAVGLYTASLGVGGLAVAGWFNVAAAGQQQGVELLGRRKRL
jgi:hypothetical protein